MTARNRLGFATLTFAVAMVAAGFAKASRDCPLAKRFEADLGWRTLDGGWTDLSDIPGDIRWEQLSFDGLVYYVTADGGWKYVDVDKSGHAYFVPLPWASRTYGLSDGGHLTELAFPDGGRVCFPIEGIGR
jgi:hypothetical protein